MATGPKLPAERPLDKFGLPQDDFIYRGPPQKWSQFSTTELLHLLERRFGRDDSAGFAVDNTYDRVLMIRKLEEA